MKRLRYIRVRALLHVLRADHFMATKLPLHIAIRQKYSKSFIMVLNVQMMKK